jgi:UDP-N-acetylglucosamine--N-acetylmuramyl-(pentapeptide) pyrophosphoryl-undecaprenol N-acetylglucosamine transferase
MPTIAFAGGGTGGHIYPGLAVAERLVRLLPCRIIWIGSHRGMDREAVTGAGMEFFGIPAGKLRRYCSFRNILDAARVGLGFFAARRVLKQEKPALLFSKGGFVSVPPCAAAAHLGIPVFIHESDYSPGLATRITLRFAAKVFTAFADTALLFPPKKRGLIQQSGNPIRRAFQNAGPEAGRAFLGVGPEERLLLVLGGSLGARRLNELVRQALPGLTKTYTVVHQTGPKTPWDVEAGERYRPYPFIRAELPQVIAAAEMVVCRSGAGTIWECAALGKPMALIPLQGPASRGDQVENAAFLEKAGAALVLRDEADPQLLVETIGALAADGERRRAMGEAAARFAVLDGAEIIAQAITAFLGKPSLGKR